MRHFRHAIVKLSALFLILGMSACQAQLPEQDLPTQTIWIEDRSFVVEVASDDFSRGLGLMGRTHLPEGTGMLFVWDDNAPRWFWMKNTLIPLDIIYFRNEPELGYAVLDSWATAVPCKADPCPPYPSKGAAQYVVELPARSVERYGWKEGARLYIKAPPAKK